MKRLLNLFFCLSAVMMLSVPQFAAAQTAGVTVSGKVSDQNGLPIIGAGVVLSSDSSTGTTTDLDGNYTITVPADATLNFSCIGYKDEAVSVNGRSKIDVVLSEDNEFIEETVVIGYGVQRKSDITGSVASVKSSELSNRSTSDAAAALQGKAAGVQIINSSGAPGEAAKIRVRGYSSNSGNIGPLLIVDGLKVDNIQYLDPSMIQNIEILKDAASAAIYGAEAGNGVVLITTKSGASENGRSSITYSYKLTRQDLGKKAELFDAASWIAYKEASGFDMEATLKQNNYDGTDTDWFDVVFGPSWSQQHSMTFQGGNDKGHFFTSINYVDNDGIVRGDKDVYKRLSAQINADYRLYDWIPTDCTTRLPSTSTTTTATLCSRETRQIRPARASMCAEPCSQTSPRSRGWYSPHASDIGYPSPTRTATASPTTPTSRLSATTTTSLPERTRATTISGRTLRTIISASRSTTLP